MDERREIIPSELHTDLSKHNELKEESKILYRKHSPFVLMHKKNTQDSEICDFSKSENNESSLFSLNRLKLKKRSSAIIAGNFNDDQPIIDFSECLKILKRLNLYPSLIANYDLKQILQNKCESKESKLNRNLEICKTASSFSSSFATNINMKDSCYNQITFKQFEDIFSKHLLSKSVQLFSHMNQGCKTYYGFLFYTKNSRMLTTISPLNREDEQREAPKDKFKTPVFHSRKNNAQVISHKSQISNCEKIRMVLESAKGDSCILSKSPIEVSSTEDQTPIRNNLIEVNNKFVNIDPTKQIVMKAGSIHLDDPPTKSKSSSKLKQLNNSVLSKGDQDLLYSLLSEKKQRRNNMENSISKTVYKELENTEEIDTIPRRISNFSKAVFSMTDEEFCLDQQESKHECIQNEWSATTETIDETRETKDKEVKNVKTYTILNKSNHKSKINLVFEPFKVENAKSINENANKTLKYHYKQSSSSKQFASVKQVSMKMSKQSSYSKLNKTNLKISEVKDNVKSSLKKFMNVKSQLNKPDAKSLFKLQNSCTKPSYSKFILKSRNKDSLNQSSSLIINKPLKEDTKAGNDITQALLRLRNNESGTGDKNRQSKIPKQAK